MSRRQQLDRPGAPDGPPGDDTGCTDPARRHGRLLRLGVPARPPRAARHPGDRRRRRHPRRRALGHLRGPARRRPLGDADDPRPPAVPDRRRCSHPDSTRYAEVSAAVMEVFREVTPAGRAALARRGVPRRLRSRPPARSARRHRRDHPCADPRRAGHHLLGRGRAARSSSPSSRRPGPSPTACSSSPPTASSPSCTRCRSARCGEWGRRPRRC